MGYEEERDGMYEKAKSFAEGAKGKLSDGFKFVIENVDVATNEAKNMACMKDDELEEYLKKNGKSVLYKIMDAVKEYSGKMKDNADIFPSFNARAEKADNIVVLIKQVLDEEELNGWGKYPEITETLRIWILKIFKTSYKKPTLLSMAIETLTLPCLVAGVMVCDGIINHIEKKKQTVTVADEEKVAPAPQRKRIYRTYCWDCHHAVTEADNRCPKCGWYICSFCGKCSWSCI